MIAIEHSPKPYRFVFVILWIYSILYRDIILCRYKISVGKPLVFLAEVGGEGEGQKIEITPLIIGVDPARVRGSGPS